MGPKLILLFEFSFRNLGRLICCIFWVLETIPCFVPSYASTEGAHNILISYSSFTGIIRSCWGWSESRSIRQFCEKSLCLFVLEAEFLKQVRCWVNDISSRLILRRCQLFLECRNVIVGFVRYFEVGDDGASCGGGCDGNKSIWNIGGV